MAGVVGAIYVAWICVVWFVPGMLAVLQHVPMPDGTTAATLPLLAMTAIVLRATSSPWPSISWRQWLVAIVIAVGIWAIERPNADQPVGDVVNAVTEEIAWRFVMIGGMYALTKRIWLAVVIAALWFAVMHVPHDLALGHPLAAYRYGLILLDAFILSMLWFATRNLAIAMVTHLFMNLGVSSWIAWPGYAFAAAYWWFTRETADKSPVDP
ncbi:MAG: CPBP family intramembrane metalloprotease [Kofleriaceae bacterium]